MTQPDSPPPTARAVKAGRRPLLPSWRRDSLRTTLWLVPAVLVAGVIVLFLATYALDRAANTGSACPPGSKPRPAPTPAARS